MTFAAAAGPLTVRTHHDGDAIVLALEGELDLATVDAVRESIEGARERSPSKIIVDLGGLTFIDSTGLALFVSEAKRAAAEAEPTLELRPGPRAVQRLFELAGVTDRLPFVEPPVSDT